jgi:hypothetical protein
LTGSLAVASTGVLLLSWETPIVVAARSRTSRVLAACGLGTSHPAPAKITAAPPTPPRPVETTADVFAAIGEQYEPSLDDAPPSDAGPDIAYPGAGTLDDRPISSAPTLRAIPADLPAAADDPFAEPSPEILQTNLQVESRPAEVARKAPAATPATGRTVIATCQQTGREARGARHGSGPPAGADGDVADSEAD